MLFSPVMQQLMDSFLCLPGVGARSAQRMVLHLLERDRKGGLALSKALETALRAVGNCSHCRMLTEFECCHFCSDDKRNASQICIVEKPADMLAIEAAGGYLGYYFILLGHLSPIDGVGPDALGLDKLLLRLDGGVGEVILATNPTVEGEATAHYITELIASKFSDIQVTRIAHGVPLGGELEFVDGGTLARAVASRRGYLESI